MTYSPFQRQLPRLFITKADAMPRRPVHLLLIDPQNDFCDLPATACPPGLAPALPVPGADADMQRLAALIDACGAQIDAITLTQDEHQRHDIAHPSWWVDASGAPVPPFTAISAAQLQAGEFRTADAAAHNASLRYLQALEAVGRYRLMVWPVHCIAGHWGQRLHAGLEAACARWEQRSGHRVFRVSKGQHPGSEHYSAFMAEVPDPAVPATQLNRALLERLANAGELVVAGEAASHCVKATVEHLVQHLPDGARRVVLLQDGISPVPGFEAPAQAFMAAMQAQGARLMRCAEWSEWAARGAAQPTAPTPPAATAALRA